MEGFGAFREAAEVDFEDVELAALVGPTGSGKSTIIDGITFALYGSVARYDHAGLVSPVVNQLSTEAKVALDFDVGDERYTAVRVVRRQPSGNAITKEARLERGEEILAGRATDMGPAISALLGLDFDRFTKTVVLPQGRFADFLHDEPRKRQELLRHLLDLDVYSRMGSVARRRADSARERLDEIEGQLQADAPTANDVKRLSALAKAAESARADLAAVMDEIAAIDSELATATGEVARVAGLVRLAAAVTVPEGVRELAAGLESARGAHEEAQSEHRGSRNERDEAKRRADDGPDAAACRSLLADHQRLGELDASLVSFQEAEQLARDECEAAQAADENLAQELRAASDAFERIRSVKSAEVLIAQLSVGEPCPVCLQPVEELPDHDIDTELERFRADYDKARSAKASSDAALRQASEAATRAEALRQTSEAERDALASRLAQEPDAATLASQIAAAEELARAAQDAAVREAEAYKELEVAKSNLDELIEREQAAQRDYWQARQGLAELEPPESEGALLGDWEMLAAWAEDQQQVLAAQQQSADGDRQDAAKRRDDAAGRARAVCEPHFDPGDDLGRYPTEMALAAERARADHDRAERERRARVELEQRAQQLRDERAVASELGRLLRSDGFERWLMEEAVARLLEQANERLLGLSGGQYSFVADGTSFDVRDHHNADEVRAAKTLSGGETFLASLSLALALSESSAELAAQDRPGLDSLFLDEGFGTLDPDALDVVGSAIEELGAAGRMVCVVTHIREVAERMPVRFEVSKGPNSSSVARVEA